MKVTVKLYGTLRRHRPVSAKGQPHHPFPVELLDDATVADLIVRLQITNNFVHAVAVNGEAAAEDTHLVDGDQVGLFPPAAGG